MRVPGTTTGACASVLSGVCTEALPAAVSAVFSAGTAPVEVLAAVSSAGLDAVDVCDVSPVVTRLTRTPPATTGVRGSRTLSGKWSTCPRRSCVGSETALSRASSPLSSP